MLTLFGQPQRRDCDGLSRRSFLRIGALGVGAGALSMADLFRAEAAQGSDVAQGFRPARSREHRIARGVHGWLDSPAADAVAADC